MPVYCTSHSSKSLFAANPSATATSLHVLLILLRVFSLHRLPSTKHLLSLITYFISKGSPLISEAQRRPALHHLESSSRALWQHWLSWNHRFTKPHHEIQCWKNTHNTPRHGAGSTVPSPMKGIQVSGKLSGSTDTGQAAFLNRSHNSPNHLLDHSLYFPGPPTPSDSAKDAARTNNHKSQGICFISDKVGPKGHQWENTSFWRKGGKMRK